MGYFPIRVMFEDENAIDPTKAYSTLSAELCLRLHEL